MTGLVFLIVAGVVLTGGLGLLVWVLLPDEPIAACEHGVTPDMDCPQCGR
jgi:hypothetical protein